MFMAVFDGRQGKWMDYERDLRQYVEIKVIHRHISVTNGQAVTNDTNLGIRPCT